MELDRIFLTRDQNRVFNGLSLRLTEHRIGLIGANGSGKSSLLRLIKGLLVPDSGSVSISGSVGFVFQNPEHQLLFPTAMEELCFGLIEQGVLPEQAQQRAHDLLATHGYAHIADCATHELSDGQKQLLCIFSVILDGASTLLLDEPFASLDLKTTRNVMRFIATLPQQLVLATHDLELVNDFDRVIWLDEGVVRSDGPPSQVILAYRESV